MPAIIASHPVGRQGVRKEDHLLPALRRMEKKNAFGVYFIFKSMELGRTFRITVPKYPTQDPNYRILAHQRSRFTQTLSHATPPVSATLRLG